VLLLLLAHSKAESKQLWRPRSTSVKDRQSSKGQGGRASSLDSESSPDSWHSTQVRPWKPPHLEASRSRPLPGLRLWAERPRQPAGVNLCAGAVIGAPKVCLRSAEPDPGLRRAAPREHCAGERRGVAGAGEQAPRELDVRGEQKRGPRAFFQLWQGVLGKLAPAVPTSSPVWLFLQGDGALAWC